MATHTSASTRVQTPHVNGTTRTNTIVDALKRRAQAVLSDKSIDAQDRAVIRYALETNDPWLARLVRRVDDGENVTDDLQDFDINEDEATEEKIAAAIEIICRAGDGPAKKSAALLILVSAIENAIDPRALSNTAKHLAFTRCGEMNFGGMIETQVAAFEGELLRE